MIEPQPLGEFIPLHWEYPEKSNPLYKPTRVVTSEAYLELSNPLVRTAEYFFDMMNGRPIFGRYRAGSNDVTIDIAQDIPISLFVDTSTDGERQTPKFQVLFDCALGQTEWGLGGFSYYNNSIQANLYRFCRGFSAEDSPGLELTFLFNNSDNVKLYEEHIMEGKNWTFRAMQDYAGGAIFWERPSGTKIFHIQRRVEGDFFVIEEAYIEGKYRDNPVVKTMRTPIRPNIERAIAIATTSETLFDPATKKLIHAPWRDLPGFLDNPSVSYRGPLPQLLRELGQK
ncbi:MAG: hypothetical protein AAB414_04665 [Patescibacteria group bacterium]